MHSALLSAGQEAAQLISCQYLPVGVAKETRNLEQEGSHNPWTESSSHQYHLLPFSFLSVVGVSGLSEVSQWFFGLLVPSTEVCGPVVHREGARRDTVLSLLLL